MLTIRLLGEPQLLLGQQPIRVTRRKSRALVYYLASHNRPLSREHLLSFFWPDVERSAAQQTLRTTLHGLRKALGTALLAGDESLSLAPDTDVDARVFESRLTPPTSDLQLLASTLDLYRDDFLSGFALPDAPQFDDWVSVERERFRRLAVRGLSALSQLHEANNDCAAALDAIDRALAFDPLQEDLQRTALRLHYLAGDRAGAIRRYESLRQLLDQEMGVPPMAETRALYDAIVTDTLNAERRTMNDERSSLHVHRSSFILHRFDALPFIGRSAELATLRTLASNEACPLVLIEGEPGIGKTRLAEEFVPLLGALTLAGKARELEQSLPYQPVIEALRSLLVRSDWPALQAGLRAGLPAIWLNEVARLLPDLASMPTAAPAAPPAADESRLWEGIYQFLVALARQRRVVCLLDDLHWADASTLALLGYLIHRRQSDAAAAPVFFLAATRPASPRSPLMALLQSLTREGRLHRLTLTRLSVEETTPLARQLSPDYAHPLTAWLMQNSEGNPYILSELIRHARENDILHPDGTLSLSALPASPVVPPTVYTVIQSRLARLSDAARRALDAAVAVGREFEFEVVARAAALSENAALAALDELRAANLIHPQGPGEQRFTFDHSLTMEVAYREVGEPRHRLLHRRVAEALESLYRNRIDSVAGLLASHFAEGNAPERAAPYAIRAAQLASDLAAWKEALAFYEIALSGSEEKQRGPLYVALGEVCERAGEFARATEAFRAALALLEPDSAEAAAARLALGQSLFSQARFAEAIALAQEILATGNAQNAVRAESLWGTALSVEGADLVGAAEHLHAAEALLDEQGDPTQLAQIKFELGSIAAQQGNLHQAVALYREALAAVGDAEARDALPMQILARNNLAYHLHLLGDPSAEAYAREGLQLAEDNGALGMQTYLLSTLGEIALARNDLEAAERHFSNGLALAESLAAAERIAGLTANLGLVAHRRGETALAIHRLSTALARADTLGTQHLAAQIRLWLVPLLPPAEARARLVEARAIAETGGRRRLLDEVVRLEAQIQSS